jgi:hypothetical protein
MQYTTEPNPEGRIAMKGNIGLLAALVWMATAGVAVAQEDKPAVPSTDETKVAQAKAESDQAKLSYEIYENIEIMRRILDRTLTNLPGPGLGGTVHEVSSVAFSPDGKLLASNMKRGEVRLWKATDAQSCTRNGRDRNTAKCAECHAVSPGNWTFTHARDGNTPSNRHEVEGIYLKGYGGVFSITFPVERVESVAGAIKAQRPSPSEWERARNELRGEKGEAEEKNPALQPVSLTDAILKVLAENGRHFSGLDDNERLTVAVTLRLAGRAAQSSEVGLQLTNPGMAGYVTATPFDLNVPLNPEPAPARDYGADLYQSASNYTQLGDMRMKQGRMRESAEAYGKAAALYQRGVESINGEVGGERWKQKLKVAGQESEALIKLAQIYVLQGEKDRAYHVIDRAAELAGWAKSGKGGDGKTTTGASSKMPLPGRLIISAPRVLLDHVATGKITFEEFKKSAEIQYLAF